MAPQKHDLLFQWGTGLGILFLVQICKRHESCKTHCSHPHLWNLPWIECWRNWSQQLAWFHRVPQRLASLHLSLSCIRCKIISFFLLVCSKFQNSYQVCEIQLVAHKVNNTHHLGVPLRMPTPNQNLKSKQTLEPENTNCWGDILFVKHFAARGRKR